MSNSNILLDFLAIFLSFLVIVAVVAVVIAVKAAFLFTIGFVIYFFLAMGGVFPPVDFIPFVPYI